MTDLLLLLFAFVATLAAAVVTVVVVVKGRKQRLVREGARGLLEQEDRDATTAYLANLGQAKTPAELERLAARERERQRKWDGSF